MKYVLFNVILLQSVGVRHLTKNATTVKEVGHGGVNVITSIIQSELFDGPGKLGLNYRVEVDDRLGHVRPLV